MVSTGSTTREAATRGTFVGMPAFPEAARTALADSQLRANLAHATSTIRAKRLQVVGEVDHWEELRLAGAAIKDNFDLPEYAWGGGSGNVTA